MKWKDETYSISQLNLAAFLLVAGHRLLYLKPCESRGHRFAEFIFERDDRIAEDRMRFYEHQAVVDARKYAESLVSLKRRAMEKLEENANNEQTG
jgi:hypothetical protein